jgi:hypothetical protein
MTQLFSLTPSTAGVTLNQLSIDPNILPDGYSSLVHLSVGNNTVLYAYNKTTKLCDVFNISSDVPYLNKTVSGSTDLNLREWDILKAFTLGNKPYLLSYEAKSGFLGFYEVNSDYSLSKPYTFMNQRSWPTQNFTEVTPFVCVGLLYVLCYDGEKGTVAIFSLDVVATSAGGIPPLNMLNVWYHQWAKGWENFSFFQLGQSNFFFKINKAKLNVNIDHVLDSPALGSVEIGSYLQDKLPNALDVTISSSIPWTDGEPYLATFDGKTNGLNIYRIHADCQGWTNLNTTSVDAARQMNSFSIAGLSYILLYA